MGALSIVAGGFTGLFTGWWNILLAVYIIAVAGVIVVVIHDRRDPVKSLAWILVVGLIPVLGIVLYVLFGHDHRKEKIFNLKEIRDLDQLVKLSDEQLHRINNLPDDAPEAIADNRDIITLLLNNNKSVLTLNNRVRILRGGRDTFGAIYTALKAAKESIHLEYYIFEDDRVGKKILKILADKAKQGVEVRLIYDDVGSWSLTPKFNHRLRKAGIMVYPFMPVVFPWLTSRINYRNHRKIIVVDGKVGFTGGINVAERYLRGNHLGPWKDTHMMIEGEAVNMLQAIFITDWYFVSKKQLLNDRKYFPRSEIKEECPVQIASSGPDSDWASIMQAFFAAITKAKKYIHITSPYFLPNQAILTALKVAALSGIDVSVIIPSRSDSKIVYWATRSYIPELMEAGIKVHLYQRGFNHSKVFIIDGKFGSVGTANMDIRSFEDNFELSALIYDQKIAMQLEEYFQKDIQHSRLITQKMLDQKPWQHNVYESLSRLLSPLL